MEPNPATEKSEEKPVNDEASKSDILRKIISIRNISKVIPVISNSFRLDQIFRDEKKITDQIAKRPEYDDEDLTIDEQLTKIWAKKINYPMSDDHKLARVAQYYQVEQEGSNLAKEEYLEFLSSTFLDIHTDKKGFEDIVKGLKKEIQTRPFAEIVQMLNYPQFPEGTDDPLTLLADLPFPIYITTSYHDFLERALKKANKTPRTQAIIWEEGEELDVSRKQELDPNLDPITNPIVYHLFGMENDPGSIVLSEDDYLKFLVTVVSDTDTQNPIVPNGLKRALSSSHLILLGYHLRDWDFRVLFRFILNYRSNRDLAKKGISILLKPKRSDPHLLDYLKQYFGLKQFEIEWDSPENFTKKLWDVWKGQQS